MPKTKSASRPTTPARRGPPLGNAALAIVFALLVLAFFNEVMLQGKTFTSPDAQQPAGFVRMGERSITHDHVYPLWNPYVFLGMPSFASGTYNPYIYPPDWPLALIQRVVPLPPLTWLILYYFLAAWFTALLAREWGARAEGALLAGVLFAFTPNLVAIGSHGHGSQLVDSAYLPLLVWLAARWIRRGGVQHLGWLALAGGFQMLRGHAQVVYYTWLAIGLYVAIDLIAALVKRDAAVPAMTRLARAAGVLVAMVLAFGLAGFYNLPLRDYAKYSIRGGGPGGGVGIDYATAWSMGPWELGTFVIPNAVGFGGQTYWGAMPFTDYPNAYVGMVAAVLALPAFLAGGVPALFALALGLFAVLVAFGEHGPVYGLLYRWLPLFNKFRVPVMILLLAHLAIALGVAWGWSRVLASAESAAAAGGKTKPATDRRLARLMLIAASVLGLVFLVGVLGQGGLRAGYVASAVAHKPGYPPQAAELVYGAYVRDLGRACVMGLLVIGVITLVRRRSLPGLAATMIALVLLLVDLWPVGRELMTPVIGEPVMNTVEVGRDDVVDWLEPRARDSLFRVLALEEFRSNRFTGFGITTIGGYHAAKPRIAQDLFDRNAQLTMPWLILLNTRYIVTDQPPERVGLPVAFQGASARVYEVPSALPRATVIGRYRVAPFDSTLIDSIAAGRVDVATTTTLERDPGLALGPVTGATARVTSYRLDDVTVDVQTPGPALLRLADLWYPDWVATVDGRPAPILRADYLLRAVPVPAGHHVVTFRFHSRAVRDGLMLSLASLAVVLVLVLFGILRRPRAPDASTVAEAA